MKTNGLFLTLALALAPSCGGASDPKALTNEGSAALSAGKYSEAAQSFEQALAAMDATNPDWMPAKLGLIEALVHTDATRAKDEFLALAKSSSSKVTDRDFAQIGNALGQAGKIKEAGEVLTAGLEMYAESPQLIALRDSLGDMAKASGDSEALDNLKGLGYAGD
jgi:thioredoxin-like negative regulator of GroEL